MASAVVFKGAPLAGLVKEIPAAPSAAVNGAPLAGLVKELPAAPSAAVNGAPLAGLVKELPAAPSAAVNGAPLAGLVKELPAAPSAAVNGAPLAGLVKELPAAPAVVAFKGVPLAGVKDLPVAPSVPVPGNSGFSARHLLATMGHDDDESTTTEESSDEDDDDDIRRALSFSVPKPFSGDVLDLFREPMKLTKMLSLIENGGAASRTSYSGHGWWVSKEDDDALQLKVVMPGLGKEYVKVSAEKNILVVKGEGDKNPEDGDKKDPPKYSRRFELPAEAFKMDQIKAEMNNGVLKVTVPKIKDEERKDVFQIKVE